MNCLDDKVLAQFVSELLTPERAAAISEHLTRCEQCKKTHTKMSDMTARLAAEPEELDVPDFVAGVMDRVRGEVEQKVLQPPPSRRWRWMWGTLLSGAAAAAMLVVVRPHIQRGIDQGFQSRGTRSGNPDRWVSIESFRATKTEYEPVRGEIAADDALAFAYTNPSDEGFRFLMIFAVDDRGRMFWYYPARDEGRSVRIGRTARAELSDEIRHELAPGGLRIYGIFSRQTHEVKEVEDEVARRFRSAGSLERLGRLHIEGAGQQSLLVRVVGGATK